MECQEKAATQVDQTGNSCQWHGQCHWILLKLWGCGGVASFAAAGGAGDNWHAVNPELCRYWQCGGGGWQKHGATLTVGCDCSHWCGWELAGGRCVVDSGGYSHTLSHDDRSIRATGWIIIRTSLQNHLLIHCCHCHNLSPKCCFPCHPSPPSQAHPRSSLDWLIYSMHCCQNRWHVVQGHLSGLQNL